VQGNAGIAEPLQGQPGTLRRRPDRTYLGRVLVEQGKLDAAEPPLQAALKFFREDPVCQPRPELAAQAANWLGAIRLARTNYAEAEPYLLSGTEQFFAATADMTPNERRLAVGHIVSLYQDRGEPEQATYWRKRIQALNGSGTAQ